MESSPQRAAPLLGDLIFDEDTKRLGIVFEINTLDMIAQILWTDRLGGTLPQRFTYKGTNIYKKSVPCGRAALDGGRIITGWCGAGGFEARDAELLAAAASLQRQPTERAARTKRAITEHGDVEGLGQKRARNGTPPPPRPVGPLVGRRVEVWWTGDKKWFAGTVMSISPDGDYEIHYDDGDVDWETLDGPNASCDWRFEERSSRAVPPAGGGGSGSSALRWQQAEAEELDEVEVTPSESYFGPAASVGSRPLSPDLDDDSAEEQEEDDQQGEQEEASQEKEDEEDEERGEDEADDEQQEEQEQEFELDEMELTVRRMHARAALLLSAG